MKKDEVENRDNCIFCWKWKFKCCLFIL